MASSAGYSAREITIAWLSGVRMRIYGNCHRPESKHLSRSAPAASIKTSPQPPYPRVHRCSQWESLLRRNGAAGATTREFGSNKNFPYSQRRCRTNCPHQARNETIQGNFTHSLKSAAAALLLTGSRNVRRSRCYQSFHTLKLDFIPPIAITLQ